MKFYDMRKDPIICPSCNTQFDTERSIKVKRAPAAKAVAKAAPVPSEDLDDEIDTDDLAVLDDDMDDIDDVEDADDDLIEDVTDLGDDSGDMAEVIVNIDGGRDEKE
ncbi:FYDLN acid domain-containing protein [Magnetospira thiophila]